MEAYIDANWAGSMIDRKSTSDYCNFLGKNLVTWRSKKQAVVARLSAEAKFRAMVQGLWVALFKNHSGRSWNKIGRNNEVILW